MIFPKEMLIVHLLDEIKRQCEFVLIANNNLNQALQDDGLQQAQQNVFNAFENRDQITQNPNHSSLALDQALEALKQAQKHEQDTREGQALVAWFNIHSLLSASGNISKLLWLKPKSEAKETKEDREDQEIRKELRESLAIDRAMNTYLFGRRGLRNHFEHYDKDVVSQARTSNGIVEGIGSSSATANIEEGNILRFFYTDTFTIAFWGDKIEVRLLVAEIEALREKAIEAKKICLDKLFLTRNVKNRSI